MRMHYVALRDDGSPDFLTTCNPKKVEASGKWNPIVTYTTCKVCRRRLCEVGRGHEIDDYQSTFD